MGNSAFEGFTTFIRPSRLEIQVSAPKQVRPGEEMVVRLSCNSSDEVLVLLSIRDERLTSTDNPDVALGSSLKSSVHAATEDFSDSGFESLDPYLEEIDRALFFGAETNAIPDAMPIPPYASLPRGARMLPVSTAGTFRTRAKKAEEPIRKTFPEVLFYGLIALRGQIDVHLQSGQSMATFGIEAFALHKGDWALLRRELTVAKPLRADLELPLSAFPGDKVWGKLRLASASGEARVTLTRDGVPVALPLSADGSVATPAELEFKVVPGTYCVWVQDPKDGAEDRLQQEVSLPGKFKSQTREVGLLRKGDCLNLDEADALSLRVLPGLEKPFDCLVTATASYAHLCCEQTAAKILAAVFWYLTASDPGKTHLAEEVILAGVARLEKMFLPGKGFSLYPRTTSICEHWSILTVHHLMSLGSLAESKTLSPAPRKAVVEGMAMATSAAEAHQMHLNPNRINDFAACFRATTGDGDRKKVRAFLASHLEITHNQVKLVKAQGWVAARAACAYAAATLIALKEHGPGIMLANQVTRQFNDQGRLYSTVDSAAAIALMLQLKDLGVGEARLRVNGQEMSSAEAAALSDRVEAVEVLEGIASLEVTRLHEEDWTAMATGVRVTVGFTEEGGKQKSRFRQGDRALLKVHLKDGYKEGDLVHVCLPACMSWIRGGGKVKRFSVDFEGKDTVHIPVALTGKLDGKQHFAVCVRNMFEEERMANPGPISVKPKGLFF